MKVLVLVADYPNNQGGVPLMYVHTRNIEYVKNGIDVTVLNFRAQEPYVYEGIRVINLPTYESTINENEYETLILHAANIRNHYRFLKKYEKNFNKMFFFYHGHEVLRINDAYSKPYDYVKKSWGKYLFQNIYDTYKLSIWRRYLPRVKQKSEFIFVSNWMKDNFFKYTKIKEHELDAQMHVTYNSVGRVFEENRFNDRSFKEYDFITIRSVLDGSKYCIDLVNQWAKNTPKAKFLVIGKGVFFEHHKRADNIDLINTTFNHSQIMEYLDKARFALMPTRTDAQGLMMCEMAAYGIPVITSNINVCHEVFDGFKNVYWVENQFENKLDRFLDIKSECMKDDRYYLKNTVKNEIDIILGERE